jgi:hypothetical protein
MTEHPNLAAALVAALADVMVVDKGNTAKIPLKDGKGSYSYDYADIADVVKRTRPALAEHGLVALTPIHDHGNGLACTVVIVHTSGERMDFGPFPFPHGKDAQATGSMVTYHRRYALVAALGMAAGDDDDGAAAAPRVAEPVRKPIPPLAGWASLEEQDAAHEDFRSTVADSSEEIQEHLRDFRKAVGLPWPMPKADLDEMWSQLAAASDATNREAGGGARTAPVASSPSSKEGEDLVARARRIASEKSTPDAKVAAAGGGE